VVLRKITDGFFLVGVAHILPGSVKEVRETIRREHPEIVAIELCPYRYAVLSGKAQSQPTSSKKIVNPLEFILTWMLSLIQTKFARETGSPAGTEMIAAMQEAHKIGARVEFIDRDIRVTLARLNSMMPLGERLKLTVQMLFTMLLPRGKVKIETLTEDEVVKHLISEFYNLSPTTYRVMIKERDEFMAQKLAPLLEDGRRVVCVVGAGHLPGLQKQLQEVLSELERKIWWRTSLEIESEW